MKLQKKDGNVLTLMLALAFFNFIFLGIEYQFDNMMALITGPEQVVTAQGYILGASVLGFLLYPAAASCIKEKFWQIVVFAGALAGVICVFVIWQHTSYGTILAAGCICFILIGMAGSAVHYYLSRAAAPEHLAKTIGISYAVGIFLQFLNNNLIKNDITLTIDSVKGAGLVNEISKKLNKKVYAHIKIDTGLSRYGFDYKNYKEIINMIKENENIIFEGIYSHFSNSLASDNSFSNIQYERLINVIEKIEKEKIKFKYKHICNSSGFFKYKDKHLNAARVGSAFSGCATGIKTDLKKIGLFHTKLTKVRNIKKGDYVGYANSYIAKKDMKIGILETGYYDGVGLELITQRFKFKSRLKNALLSLKSLIKGDNMTLNIDGKIINVIGQIGMHDVVIDITGLDYKEDDDIYFYYRPVYINENVKRVYK